MTDPAIIFEDEDILVVNKPAGMIVNRADTTKAVVTLQEWAKSKIPDLKTQKPEHDFFLRGGVVHRLDKETSGLIVIAKNEESFVHLQSQFKEGKVEKTYVALCHGRVVPPEGEVRAPIGRLPWNRTHFGVFPQGRESRTEYRVSQYYEFSRENNTQQLSLIECFPKTGRTHQIRVHMQYLGFPLFADELYAGRKTGKKDRKLLPRHFLHAKRISFLHPKTNERVEFESELPEDLQTFLQTLQKI